MFIARKQGICLSWLRLKITAFSAIFNMSNTIPERIADFLKEYPPFSLLDRDLLRQISARVIVQYFKPGSTIFRQGDMPGQFIYVVREGAVHLLREENGNETLIDECDEGDVFGIRPLLAEDAYALSARTAEESLIYAVNIEGFEQSLRDNPRISYYLASNLAAGAAKNYQRIHQGKFLLHKDQLIDGDFNLVEIQSIERSKEPVSCPENMTIRDAASIMSAKGVGSILVTDAQNLPIGIITDKDFRHKVATGIVPLTEPVTAIMSGPVVTARASVTVAEVQIEMVRRRIHHLCLTEDGTDKSPALGVISEHDLLVLQGNNPAVLIREIRRSTHTAGLRQIRERAEDLLKKYLYQEVAIAYIASIITEINDALIERVLELSEAEMAEEGHTRPNAEYCWLALGSEGRGEQLLRTDQDNALVFENVSKKDYKTTQSYFLALAAKVNDKLHACGFEYCPADMMARNPNWCMSLDQWKKQFSQWIFEPTPKAVMHCSIFFDYRPVYGNRALAAALTEHIFQSVQDQTIFLSFLAKSAQENPPPLTFFRNFMVEGSGEHKDEFDVKARAMMPLVDAGRVLILQARQAGFNNTLERFARMAELEPHNRELFELAADAYEMLLRYRTMQGLQHGDSGRFFKPSDLSKMERLNLRNSFQPIKELQSLLRVRFWTDNLQG